LPAETAISEGKVLSVPRLRRMGTRGSSTSPMARLPVKGEDVLRRTSTVRVRRRNRADRAEDPRPSGPSHHVTEAHAGKSVLHWPGARPPARSVVAFDPGCCVTLYPKARFAPRSVTETKVSHAQAFHAAWSAGRGCVPRADTHAGDLPSGATAPEHGERMAMHHPVGSLLQVGGGRQSQARAVRPDRWARPVPREPRGRPVPRAALVRLAQPMPPGQQASQDLARSVRPVRRE
jgi:hypothetical protein